jgi:hypothetical protein
MGLAQELGGKLGQWVSMFSLTSIPLHVVDIIFDDVTDITEDAPARQLGGTILTLWYFAWTLIPAAVLLQRYRKLTP